jgi:hypothetical protein
MSELSKAKIAALNEMWRDGRHGTAMFRIKQFGGARLRMLREMKRDGLCESLWMGEHYWRITQAGRLAVHEATKPTATKEPCRG